MIAKKYARPAEQSHDFHAILNRLAQSRDHWNRPTDVVDLSKFADWLEEREDPRHKLVQQHINSLEHLGQVVDPEHENTWWGPMQDLHNSPYHEFYDIKDLLHSTIGPASESGGFHHPVWKDPGLSASVVIPYHENYQLEHEPTLVMHWNLRHGPEHHNANLRGAMGSEPVSFHAIMDPMEAKHMINGLASLHRQFGKRDAQGNRNPAKLAIIAKLIKRAFPQTVTPSAREEPSQYAKAKAPKGIGWAELTPFGMLMYKPGKFLPEEAIPPQTVAAEEQPQKKAEKESPKKEGKSHFHALAGKVIAKLAEKHPAIAELVGKKK